MGLDTGCHTQPGQTFKVLGPDHLNVLNTVGNPRRSICRFTILDAGFFQFLKNRYHLSIGPVADGVDHDGQPGPISFFDGFSKFIHRKQGHPALSIQVGFKHPGSPCSHTAVCKILQMSDSEAVAAKSGSKSQSDSFIQAFTGNTDPASQVQFTHFIETLPCL